MTQPRSRRAQRQPDRLTQSGLEEDMEALEPGMRWEYDKYDGDSDEESVDEEQGKEGYDEDIDKKEQQEEYEDADQDVVGFASVG